MFKESSIDQRIGKWKSSEGVAILYQDKFLETFKKYEVLKIGENSSIYKLDAPDKVGVLKKMAFDYINKKGLELGADIAVITRELTSAEPSKYDFTVFFCVKNNAENRRKYAHLENKDVEK